MATSRLAINKSKLLFSDDSDDSDSSGSYIRQPRQPKTIPKNSINGEDKVDGLPSSNQSSAYQRCMGMGLIVPKIEPVSPKEDTTSKVQTVLKPFDRVPDVVYYNNGSVREATSPEVWRKYLDELNAKQPQKVIEVTRSENKNENSMLKIENEKLQEELGGLKKSSSQLAQEKDQMEKLLEFTQDLLEAKESQLKAQTSSIESLECQLSEISAENKAKEEKLKRQNEMLDIKNSTITELNERSKIQAAEMKNLMKANEDLQRKCMEVKQSELAMDTKMLKLTEALEAEKEAVMKEFQRLSAKEENLVAAEKYIYEKEKMVRKGVKSINNMKKGVEADRAEVTRMLSILQDTLKEYYDKLSPFKNVLASQESIVSQITSSQEKMLNKAELLMADHTKEYHKVAEEEKILKKQANNRLISFNEKYEEYKSLEQKAQHVRDALGTLETNIKSDIESLNDIKTEAAALLQVAVPAAQKNSEIMQEARGFTERLCNVYWNDDDSKDFALGLDAHKYIVQKELQMEEVILKNQTVSLIMISKEGVNSTNPKAIKEVFSMGHGNGDNESFMNAVSNIQYNRQFMRSQRRRGTSVCSTATSA